MQTVDRSDAAEKEGIKLVRGNREYGNLENTFRTIRRATSEDSDHLPMQGQSGFVVCDNKQACKLQFFGEITNLWLNTSPFQ